MSRKSRGHLLVLSGPSGAGKGTLRKGLFERLPQLVFSISCTTRAMRPHECDGVDYRFVTDEQFRKAVNEGRFLEWAEVHGHFYGTLEEDVERDLQEGRDVLLEIDVQGAMSVRKSHPDAVLVFILPPSQEVLAARLRGRNSESDQDLSVRLRNAEEEISHAVEYDYRIVNDDADRATDALVALVSEIIGENRGYDG